MVSILKSPRSAERFAAAARFVAAQKSGEEILLIGPTREAIDELARDLCGEEGALRATFGWHRTTLTQVAARLATATLADRGLSYGGGLSAQAMTARAVFEALGEGSLHYFTPVARAPNFARAASATLQELRLEGVSKADLEAGEAPARDLAELLRRFEEQLSRASMSDRAVLLETAAEVLLAADEKSPEALAIARMPKLFLDVPVDTRLDRKLVSALVSRAPSVLITVAEGDDRSLSAFSSLAGAQVIAREVTHAETPLHRLQAELFSTDEPEAAGSGEGVSFFSAPGEGRECVEIARRIQDETRRGVRLDAIAIFVHAPDLYADLLEHALRRASVPAYFAFGSRRPHPSGRAFLALLACGAEGFSANRFAEYLSLGQVPRLNEEGEPEKGRDLWAIPTTETLSPMSDPLRTEPARGLGPDSEDGRADNTSAPEHGGTLRAPRRWERLLVEAAVLGGKDRWERRLDGLAALWEQQKAAIEKQSDDTSATLGYARRLADLEHLKRFALPLIEKLASMRSEATWGEWLERLEELAGLSLRKPDAVLSLLSELRPMASVGPVGLDEVRQVLEERLSTIQETPPKSRRGRVFVATTREARGQSFEVVFVPGLAERVFPQKPREDPMLLDDARRALSEGQLCTQTDRASQERLLLRLSVGSAKSRLHLSYPRIEVRESRPRVPSFYGLDVLRATTGTIPDSETIEEDAARASNARLAWPAPDSPSRAIDEAEHDLAVLGPLLRSAGSAGKQGRARYLLTQNPHLARSLRTRWWRWENPKWGRLDGLVDPTPETRAALSPYRLRQKPYSVSALQKYAACPYRFFLSSIVGLSPRQDIAPLEQMDPQTRGLLFHEVQAEVLSSLSERGHLPLSPDALLGPFARLDEVLEERAAEYEDRLAPPIRRVWQDEVKRLQADLRVWLQVIAGADREWAPIAFELPFGPPDPSRKESGLGAATIGDGYLLRGAIDLVERHLDAGVLRVTDYKTGLDTTRPGLTVGGGEVLQPVLYGLAVEALMKSEVAASRLFFCTARGGFSERTLTMDDRAKDAGIRVLALIDRSIEVGFLPPLPRKEACVGCSFRGVCGPHEEERARRKNPRSLPSDAPLDELNDLRSRP